MSERSNRDERETTQIIPTTGTSGAMPPIIPPADSGRYPYPQPNSSNKRAWWKRPEGIIIAAIAVIVVIALVVTPIIINKQTQHTNALSECQSALSDYQDARARLRKIAADDTAISTEVGSSVTCNSSDSTDELTSSASVLRDATNAFNTEAAVLEQQKKESDAQNKPQSDSDTGSNSNNNSSDDSDNGSGANNDSDSTAAAREALQDSLDAADALIDKVQTSIADGTAKKLMVGTLTTAVNGARKILNDSGIKDSKYYKAAKATLDEAIDAVNSWVDKQASKAE